MVQARRRWPLTFLAARISRWANCTTAFLPQTNKSASFATLAAMRRALLSLSFPSGGPFDARRWPFSDTACVSQAKECPEPIPRIRPQIREKALRVRNPQRWALYLSTLLTLGDARRPSTGDGQGNGRWLDVRHATSSAFKAVKIGQFAKSRRYSSEPHDLSAGWAMRGCWRAFIRVFVTHDRYRFLKPQCEPDQRQR